MPSFLRRHGVPVGIVVVVCALGFSAGCGAEPEHRQSGTLVMPDPDVEKAARAGSAEFQKTTPAKPAKR